MAGARARFNDGRKYDGSLRLFPTTMSTARLRQCGQIFTSREKKKIKNDFLSVRGSSRNYTLKYRMSVIFPRNHHLHIYALLQRRVRGGDRSLLGVFFFSLHTIRVYTNNYTIIYLVTRVGRLHQDYSTAGGDDKTPVQERYNPIPTPAESDKRRSITPVMASQQLASQSIVYFFYRVLRQYCKTISSVGRILAQYGFHIRLFMICEQWPTCITLRFSKGRFNSHTQWPM